jgi:mycofactocin precursor
METEARHQDMKLAEMKEDCSEAPAILEEITIEEMAVDGICGIY